MHFLFNYIDSLGGIKLGYKKSLKSSHLFVWMNSLFLQWRKRAQKTGRQRVRDTRRHVFSHNMRENALYFCRY
jgi:hypothetical protein